MDTSIIRKQGTEGAASSPQSAALGKVGTRGRHGAPCHTCSDTLQWPTTRGLWICAACFVAGRPVIRGATKRGVKK